MSRTSLPARPRLDILEERCNPAGTVTASLDAAGNLLVVGDGQANELLLQSSGGVVSLVGQNNTTVNLPAGGIDTSGKVTFRLGGGDDRLTITDGVSFGKGLLADLGTGNNSFQLTGGNHTISGPVDIVQTGSAVATTASVELAAQAGDTMALLGPLSYTSTGLVNDTFKVGVANPAQVFVQGAVTARLGAGSNTADIQANSSGGITINDQSAAGDFYSINLAVPIVQGGVSATLGAAGGQFTATHTGTIAGGFSVTNNPASRSTVQITATLGDVAESFTVNSRSVTQSVVASFNSIGKNLSVTGGGSQYTNFSLTGGNVGGSATVTTNQSTPRGGGNTYGVGLTAVTIGGAVSVTNTGPGIVNTTVGVESVGAVGGDLRVTARGATGTTGIATTRIAHNAAITVTGSDTDAALGMVTGNVTAVLTNDAGPNVSATSAAAFNVTLTNVKAGSVTSGDVGSHRVVLDNRNAPDRVPFTISNAKSRSTSYVSVNGAHSTINLGNTAGAATITVVGDEGPQISTGTAESVRVTVSNSGATDITATKTTSALVADVRSGPLSGAKPPVTINATDTFGSAQFTMRGMDSRISVGTVTGPYLATLTDDASPSLAISSAESVTITLANSGNTDVSATKVTGRLQATVTPANLPGLSVAVSAPDVGGDVNVSVRNASTFLTLGTVGGTAQVAITNSPQADVHATEVKSGTRTSTLSFTDVGIVSLQAGHASGPLLVHTVRPNQVTVGVTTADQNVTLHVHDARDSQVSVRDTAIAKNLTLLATGIKTTFDLQNLTVTGNLINQAFGRTVATALAGGSVGGLASFTGGNFTNGSFRVQLDDIQLNNLTYTGGAGQNFLDLDTRSGFNQQVKVNGTTRVTLGGGDDTVTFGGLTADANPAPDPEKQVVFVGAVFVGGGPGNDNLFNRHSNVSASSNPKLTTDNSITVQ